MDDTQQFQFAIFTLDQQRYALPYIAVKRVVRAMEITYLPKASLDILGIINIQGQLIPVLNLRKRFGMPERELELQHYFVICQAKHHLIAFIVDSAEGLQSCERHDIFPTNEIMPGGIEYIDNLIKRKDGLILILDPENFLTNHEQKALDSLIIENA